MSIKNRILVMVAILSMFLPTVALGQFFAPEEPEASATEPTPEEVETPTAPAIEQYTPLYEETIFTTGPGADQVFGSRRGRIHPFLSAGGYYTDNLFNTRNDEESEWVTVYSPGIWVSVPPSRQQLVNITTLNSAPGGLEVGRFKTRSDRRFEGYALYRADIYEHADLEDQNHVNQRAEALLEYNMPGGLSLELLDIYKIDHDDYNTGDSGPTDLNKFHSNLLRPTVSYRVGPRLTLGADYSFYTVDYNPDRKNDDDREDKLYSFFGSYKLTPKLSMVLEYEHVDTDYDDETRSDSEEDNYYGGIRWRATAKSRGLLKVGYGEKEYDEAGRKDKDELLIEAKIDHRFTPKTSMYIKGVRKTYISDVSGTRDVLSNRVYIGYQQRFRPKWLGKARLEYARDDYDGDITVGSQTDEREDDLYGLRIELGFAMQKWLNISVGYRLKKRDSNFDSEDYTTNSFFAYLTATL